MATRNGANFLHDQVSSILGQLSQDDELVVSDDHSTDATRAILVSFGDPRIKIVESKVEGATLNFENALHAAKGDYLFLADQDDVWNSDKIAKMRSLLRDHDLVVCDCSVTEPNLEIAIPSFFLWNNSRKGLLRNLVRNSYMGCCMAFHRRLLDRALPFPKNLIAHDVWLGLIGEVFFDTHFHAEPLVLHRRHGQNASTTAGHSSLTIRQKLSYRIHLIQHLLQLRYA